MPQSNGAMWQGNLANFSFNPREDAMKVYEIVRTGIMFEEELSWRTIRLFEASLKKAGLEDSNAQHWASKISKRDTGNYMPDCELNGYIKFSWKMLQGERYYHPGNYSYDACFLLWTALNAVREYRKIHHVRGHF